jgi:hypothetical protein
VEVGPEQIQLIAYEALVEGPAATPPAPEPAVQRLFG